MLDTGNLGNLFAFLFKFYFSIQSVTTWRNWAPRAWKFCSGWMKLLPLRNVSQSLQSINQYDSFDPFLTQALLCIPRPRAPNCRFPPADWNDVLSIVCSRPYQWPLLYSRYRNRCTLCQLMLCSISGQSAAGLNITSVPDFITYSTNLFQSKCVLWLFSPNYPTGLGGQRVAAWVYEPDMTTFSSQCFLKLFKWGGWIHSRSAFEVLWQ